ncbi:hypothetical protein EDD16DRAFT_616199 [Pisolithus croceorrhizus]|nr:hypothetical protein EDD16DRAFT_616199 [Pisolithus croceorrhizus]
MPRQQCTKVVSTIKLNWLLNSKTYDGNQRCCKSSTNSLNSTSTLIQGRQKTEASCSSWPVTYMINTPHFPSHSVTGCGPGMPSFHVSETVRTNECVIQSISPTPTNSECNHSPTGFRPTIYALRIAVLTTKICGLMPLKARMAGAFDKVSGRSRPTARRTAQLLRGWKYR